MKKILCFLLLSMSLTIYSQRQPSPTCVSDEYLKQIINDNPDIQKRLNIMNNEISLKTTRSNKTMSALPVITIPVVVYIVYDPAVPATNISDNQVMSQINALNTYFSAYNIKFCLATRAGTGTKIPGTGTQDVPGILHINNAAFSNNTYNTSSQLLSLVNSSIIRDRYLRIWVVKSINGNSGVQGYATFPQISDFDGVVMKYDVFGNSADSTCGCILLQEKDLGKTLVHEVGHYLGLYHTFEGGCAGMNTTSCKDEGDKVCDTPPVATPNYSCMAGINSCSEVPNLPDSIDNYMDYGNDMCVHNFTPGQIERMLATINNYRSNLVSSDNLAYTGTCGFENIISSTITPSTYSPCTGSVVSFLSAGGTNVTYSWNFGDPGSSSNTSTAANPSHIYNSSLNSPYTVTLTATNGTDTVTSSEQIYVTTCTPINNSDSYWAIGRSNGLIFNSGIPAFDPNFPSNKGDIGCSSAQCDASGNLLFYTDGRYVYNNQYTMIGDNLIAFSYSERFDTNQIIILKKPNSSQYYIFSNVDYSAAPLNNVGFFYSIVNVSGSTVTLGSTHQPISFPSNSGFLTQNGALRGGGGIAAVAKCNNDGYWIITTLQKSDGHYMVVYSLTSSGVAYVSQKAIAGDYSSYPFEPQVVASPNGNKVLLGNLFLFDFDKTTGILADNPISIPTGYASFSPDSKLLYSSEYNKIVQYNLNTANISNSKSIIGTNINSFGPIQMGPDNKLYGQVSSTMVNEMTVIHKPNNLVSSNDPNACNYSNHGPKKDFGPLSAMPIGGLPNLINAKAETAYFTPSASTDKTISVYITGCNQYKFFPNVNTCDTSFNWSFKNNSTGVTVTSTVTDPVYTFTAIGTYTITLKNTANTVVLGTTSIVVANLPTPVIVGSTTACTTDFSNAQTNNSVALANGQTAKWAITGGVGTISGADNQSSVSINWTTLPGNITLTVSNAAGCTATATKTITGTSVATPVITGSNKACLSTNPQTVNSVLLQAGQTAQWSITGGAGTFSNSNQASFTVNWTSLPGTILLRVINSYGCSKTTTQTINIDTTCPNIGANDVVYTTKLRSDAKIIFGGDFTSYNGSSINRIARLNTDMSLDTSFNVGSGANNTVKCSAVTGTNAVIIGGLFSSYNGITANRLARLNDDGSFDTSFMTGTGFTDSGTASINSIAPITKGKMYVAGNFNNYNGTAIIDIAKINSDGSLDTTFSSAFTGTSGNVNCIATQSDGKILVAGDFITYGSNSSPRIVRLNASGTLDTTFNIGTGFDAPIYGLKIQPDGKILVCGVFTVYNGTSRVGMARLNTDGSLDTTFLTAIIGSGSAYLNGAALVAIDLQSDGKIIVCGGYADGAILYRLTSTGNIDTNYGSAVVPHVNSLIDEFGGAMISTTTLQPDNKIIIGGYFTGYNGVSIKDITRINPVTNVVGKTVNNSNNKTNSKDYFSNSITIYPNPTNDLVTISTNDEDIKTVLIIGIDGKLIANQNIGKSSSCQFNMGNYQNGIYILTVETVDGTIYREKIIKN